MRALFKRTWLVIASLVLASCGGGGGADNDGGFLPPQTFSISIQPTNTSLPRSFFTQVNVRVTRSDGGAVAENTPVILQSSNGQAGLISLADDPASTDTNEFFRLATSQTGRTQGGIATFFFHSRETPGTVRLTASVVDTTGRTTTSTFDMTVTNAEPPFRRLAIEANRTNFPLNSQDLGPAIGSPFTAEWTIRLRRLNGEPYANEEGGNSSTNVLAAITPALTATFSRLDDPETEINEFLLQLGSGPVLVNSSIATVFITSGTLPGTAEFVVTFTDPDTGDTLTARQTLTVAAAVAPLPSQLSIFSDQRPLYSQASGGNTTTVLTVLVSDGSGVPIPDPQSGNSRFNNVRLELVPQGTGTGESLSGLNAQNQQVDGTSISIPTINGAATAVLRAGTATGVVTVRATADRADNNVDNGIQDPVITTRPYVISDGVLYAVDITSPRINSLFINRVDPSVDVDLNSDGIPQDPDGTYSITLSAIGTDRLGNPVIQGTPLRFGLIDSPISGYPNQGPGVFDISGPDGDPVEGGTGFTAPQGRFTTAGGGAGPGDAVLVFGEESPGNSDLENARRIQTIIGPTSLITNTRFNFNDTTGVSVNNGPVLPYIIGRAVDGNVGTIDVITNEFGVASTTVNYPSSKLGKIAAVWAQGNGAIVAGSTRTVEDIELLVYPGVAPATLTASPSQIRANTQAEVLLCLFDLMRAPIPGVTLGFAINGADGEVDGQPGSGIVAQPTGANGCTFATVVTRSVLPSDVEPTIVFGAGSATATVRVIRPGSAALIATPNVGIAQGNTRVQLLLVDESGNPLPGRQIVVQCTVSGAGQLRVIQQPGVTDAEGRTESVIEASNLIGFGSAGETGECVFSTTNGTPSDTVRFVGYDACDVTGSPGLGLNCPDAPLPQFNLIVELQGQCSNGGVAGCAVFSSPQGINLSNNQVQNVFFANNVGVILTVLKNGVPVPPLDVTFIGDCQVDPDDGSRSQPIFMTQSRQCVVSVN